MKNNNSYWEKRERAWIKQQMKKDKEVMNEIEHELKKTYDRIEKDITSFYVRYAEKEEISLAEARKRIKLYEVKEHEGMASYLVSKKDFSDYANERLRIYNATMKINRLEYLKSQIGLELLDYSSDVETITTERLQNAYIEEVKRQSGILGKHRSKNIKKAMNIVVNASYKGATFSDRIWTNNDVMKIRLEQLITRSLVRGEGPIKLASEIRDLINKEYKNAKFAAERLLRTETARVQDEAQMKSFKDNGYEYVKWIAEPTAEKQCLDIAAENDGIWRVDQVPAIPVHAMCRCSKVAYVPKKGEV